MNLIIVLSIVAGAGILGGSISSLAARQGPAGPRLWLRELLYGIAAAAVVPLFLRLTESTIIEKILKDPTEPATLYFVGFCVLAAVSAQHFLQQIGRTALGEAAAARELAMEASKQVEAVKHVMVEADLEAEDEPEAAALPEAERPSLAADETTVLEYMRGDRRRFHTVRRIRRKTDLGETAVREVLEKLLSRRWVERVTANAVETWYLTAAGRRVLEQGV